MQLYKSMFPHLYRITTCVYSQVAVYFFPKKIANLYDMLIIFFKLLIMLIGS